MNYKLGKQPATYDRRTLKFAKYVDRSLLPDIPDVIGHDKLFDDNSGWGMLANDRYGCCVISSMMHQTMLWNKAAKNKEVQFTDELCIDTYHKVNNSTEDNGTNMLTALKYRNKHGIVDSDGNIYKIGAFAYLNTHNIDEIKAAVYLFGLVDIGFYVPDYCMDQFAGGRPWVVTGEGENQGGHCVPIVGFDKMFNTVTWGREQKMDIEFFAKYADEAYAIISEDYLNGNKETPEGFDLETLKQDLLILQA
jgi:hypothetical protein